MKRIKFFSILSLVVITLQLLSCASVDKSTDDSDNIQKNVGGQAFFLITPEDTLAVASSVLENGVSEGLGNTVSRRLQDGFSQYTTFTMIDNLRMKQALDQIKKGESAIYDETVALSIGRRVNARYIVIPILTTLSNGKIKVNISIFEVETGKQIGSFDSKYSAEEIEDDVAADRAIYDIVVNDFQIQLTKEQKDSLLHSLEVTEGFSNSYYGYGLSWRKTSVLVVECVDYNSPAYKAGILENDLLISIDNQNVADMSFNEIDRYLTLSVDNDKDIEVKIRRNEKEFYVTLSPDTFYMPIVEEPTLSKKELREREKAIKLDKANNYVISANGISEKYGRTSDLFFSDVVIKEINPGIADIEISKIINNEEYLESGDLYLSLWLCPKKHDGHSKTFNGYLFGSIREEKLLPGYCYENYKNTINRMRENDIPDGEYYLLLTLGEAGYGYVNNFVDFAPFEDPITWTNTVVLDDHVAKRGGSSVFNFIKPEIETFGYDSLDFKAERIENASDICDTGDFRVNFWLSDLPYSGGQMEGDCIGQISYKSLQKGHYGYSNVSQHVNYDFSLNYLKNTQKKKYVVVTINELHESGMWYIVQWANFGPWTF